MKEKFHRKVNMLRWNTHFHASGVYQKKKKKTTNKGSIKVISIFSNGGRFGIAQWSSQTNLVSFESIVSEEKILMSFY